MSLFYKAAFKLVFLATSRSDKKKHRTNKRRDDVLVRHLSYGKDGRMNLCLDARERRPLLIDIHGGGYLYGDENLNLDFGKWFSQQGFHVAIPNYPLIYKSTIRGIIQSLYLALNRLKEECEKSALFDLDRVALTGDSAGAGIAMFLVAIGQSERLQRIFGVGPLPLDIKALLLYHPFCYPKKMTFVGKPSFMERGARKTFFRMFCGKKGKDLYDLADFDEYVGEVHTLPKTFILTSTGDDYLRYQSELLKQDLEEAGLPFEYYEVDDKAFTHVYSVLQVDVERSLKANGKALSFLERALGVEK